MLRVQVVGYYLPATTPLPRAFVASAARVNINPTPIAADAITLPAGTFLVTASTSLSSAFNGADDIRCTLESPDDSVLAEAFTTAGFIGDNSLQAAVTMQAVVRSSGEQLRLLCSDDQSAGRGFDQRITALQVGTVSGT